MSSLCVFVVDDDAAFRETLCDALRAAGHSVQQACGGRAALRTLNEAPDVLLTELSMPEGDGIELITAVRRAYPTTRILAISGKRTVGGLDLLNLAAMLGAEATLQKPVGPEDILRKVAAMAAAEN